MAAEIKPVERQSSGVAQKPELLSKIEGFTADVNFAAFTPREDGVITVSDDRSAHSIEIHTHTIVAGKTSEWAHSQYFAYEGIRGRSKKGRKIFGV